MICVIFGENLSDMFNLLQELPTNVGGDGFTWIILLIFMFIFLFWLPYRLICKLIDRWKK